MAIAFLGLLVWAHHMFTTPTATVVLAFFMLSSFAIAVPTGIKIFNWIATLWRGSIVMKTPLYFAAALARAVRDRRHLGRDAGGLPGGLAAARHLLRGRPPPLRALRRLGVRDLRRALLLVPEDAGRMLSEGLGKLSFWLMFVGFNLTFLVQHSTGLSGMPRRIYDYPDDAGVSGYNLISTIGVVHPRRSACWSRCVNVIRSHQERQEGRQRPVEGQHARVVHPSPPPANNFDVVPRVRSVEPMKDIRREVLARRSRPGPWRSPWRRAAPVQPGPPCERAPSTGYRRLALATGVATFVLIIVGGIVRVSDSGLGCGPAGSGFHGWPFCNGDVVPGSTSTRSSSTPTARSPAIVGLMMLALAVLAWRRYRANARWCAATAALSCW